MLVVLMRHGIAEEGEPDEERALTPKGRGRVEDVARLLARLGVVPSVVLTSPRVRAVQTAEAVIASMGLMDKPVQTDSLDFDGSWKAFEATANRHAKSLGRDGVLLATGHQPQLGMLATQAVCGVDTGMQIRKGACVSLQFDGMVARGRGEVAFVVTARMARTLAKG